MVLFPGFLMATLSEISESGLSFLGRVALDVGIFDFFHLRHGLGQFALAEVRRLDQGHQTPVFELQLVRHLLLLRILESLEDNLYVSRILDRDFWCRHG